jgi:hypothetical protein
MSEVRHRPVVDLRGRERTTHETEAETLEAAGLWEYRYRLSAYRQPHSPEAVQRRPRHEQGSTRAKRYLRGVNQKEIAAGLRAKADRLHEEMRRLQDQADALLNVADDLDPPHPIPKTPAVVGGAHGRLAE